MKIYTIQMEYYRIQMKSIEYMWKIIQYKWKIIQYKWDFIKYMYHWKRPKLLQRLICHGDEWNISLWSVQRNITIVNEYSTQISRHLASRKLCIINDPIKVINSNWPLVLKKTNQETKWYYITQENPVHLKGRQFFFKILKNW
jgi:hypothetical protein